MKKILLLVCTALISNMALAVENPKETIPVRISCPFPLYPVSAKALGIGGTVKYAASVNEKGEVTSVETTGDEVFFTVTKSAVRKCKFEPGKPGISRSTINFRPSRP